MSVEIEIKSDMLKSHSERLSEPSIVYTKILFSDYEARGIEEFVENGKVMKKSCVVSVHPQDKMKGFKAVDFALENILAVGALDSLRESHLGVNTLSELSDSMEGSIDCAIAAVDAVEASVSQTNGGGNE